MSNTFKQSFKQDCDVAYERGDPIISDNEYEALFGNNASAMILPSSHEKKKLPVFMGSINKVRDEKALEKWLKKFKHTNCVVVSPKLDGVSALLSFDKNTGPALYSRGNGKEGTSLNMLLPWLNDWQKLSTVPTGPKGACIRGELIIKKNVFNKKYASIFKNARNMVAGQVSKKKPSSMLSDIVFVPYELIESQGPNMCPSKQLDLLYTDQILRCNTEFVWKIVQSTDVTIAMLSDLYAFWSKNLNYEIDGLVISSDSAYQSVLTGTPHTSFAFKPKIEEEETSVARVVSVTWNVSKWGVYKPVVNITPTKMKDVTISNLNGHNAAYIRANNLGKNALIKIVRSGKVIPYIVEVLQPGTEVEVPEGVWKGVDVYTSSTPTQNEQNEQNEQNADDNVLIKKLSHCLKTLKVLSLGPKTVERLVTKCKYKTFLELLVCSEQTLQTEFTPHSASNIVKVILELKSRPLLVSVLIAASGVLGQGISESKATTLLKTLDHTRVPRLNEVSNIDGFALKTATQVRDNFKKMIKFVEACKQNGLQIVWDNEV